MSNAWFLRRNGAKEGPISATRLAEMAHDGQLRPDDYVRSTAMSKWVTAERVKGLDFRVPVHAAAPVPISRVVETTELQDGQSVILLSDGTWRYGSVPVLSTVVSGEGNFLSLGASDSSVCRANGTDSGLLPGPAATYRFDASHAAESVSSARQGHHFRHARWGMSERQVRDTERDEPELISPDVIAYAREIAGLPCDAFFVFTSNQLVRGKYFFTTRSLDDQQYIADFQAVKALLVEKYGDASRRDDSEDDTHWEDRLDRVEPEGWGAAIRAGQLSLLAEWLLPETRLTLSLRSEDHQIHFAIDYISRELEALELQHRHQRHLSGL